MKKAYLFVFGMGLVLTSKVVRAQNAEDQINLIVTNTNKLLEDVAVIKAKSHASEPSKGIVVSGAKGFVIQGRCTSVDQGQPIWGNIEFIQVVARRTCSGINFLTIRLRTSNDLLTFMESDIIMAP